MSCTHAKPLTPGALLSRIMTTVFNFKTVGCSVTNEHRGMFVCHWTENKQRNYLTLPCAPIHFLYPHTYWQAVLNGYQCCKSSAEQSCSVPEEPSSHSAEQMKTSIVDPNHKSKSHTKARAKISEGAVVCVGAEGMLTIPPAVCDILAHTGHFSSRRVCLVSKGEQR